MTNFNDNNSISHDSINIIIYCIKYVDKGTIITENEIPLFEKLIKFDIPIIFIITNSPKDFVGNIKDAKDRKSILIKNEKEKYINNINNRIKEAFKNNETEKDEQKIESDTQNFIKNLIETFFVNLVNDNGINPNPIFGIDEVLSHLSKLVSEKDWNDLESSCKSNDKDKDKENWKELLKKNIFLRYYSDLDNLDKENQKKAKQYLKNLKAGAFFSGIVPGLDIGMEYYYKYLFKQKLKKLYGYDEDQAKEATNKEKERKKEKKNSIKEKDEILNSSSDSEENIKLNTDEEEKKFNDKDDKIKLLNLKKEEEKEIESKINKEIHNSGKNVSSFARGIFEVGSAVIKAAPEAGSIAARVTINSGVKVVSWALLPITCIAFGTWSVVNVHKDCEKMIEIFHKAFISLKLKTLLQYVVSIKRAVKHLDDLGKKIIKESQEEKNE
jgi:hypothetical protein